MRRLGELKSNLDTWNKITQSSDDLTVLLEMSEEEPDLLAEIETELEGLGISKTRTGTGT